MNLATKGVYLLCILFLFSCVSEKGESTRRLRWFLELKSYEYENFDAVLVLTEEGCPTCNRSFANLIKNYLDHPKALCIVSAKGNRIDLSDFLDQDNVSLDMENRFSELHITKGTASIFLFPSGLIDTVVEIKAHTLESDLKYISDRLDQL